MIFGRALKLLNYLRKSRPLTTAGVGDFILAFSSRILGIRSILFYDDFEFKLNFNLSHLFANQLVIPNSISKRSKKIIPYHGFKELAYLHPKRYRAKKKIIEKMGLKEDLYIFLREVANISMNYSDLQKDSLLEVIKEISPRLDAKGIKLVLSLEDKSRKEFYQPYCLILEEPLEDIYSIMHFALFMISSGDSMARESALLGVPCIYTGGRAMAVNNPFISWGGIYKLERKEEILSQINLLLDEKAKSEWSVKIQRIIESEMEDTTDLIMHQLAN